jgi:toluene monooxygenase electron transfer component
MTTIVAQPGGQEFDCAEGDTILRAALRSGIGMPYSCNVGSCGNCRFELIEGEVEHLRRDPPAWNERDLKRNRWLGCQALPKCPCTIKFRADDSYAGGPRPARRSAKLLSATPLTRDITEFRFRLDGAEEFLPGQYALFTVPDVEGARPYSMSNIPGEGSWQFQIKRVPRGAATGFLFDQARPGTRISLDGPYGTAYLRTESPRDIILIAGGSGLSPMVSLARGAQASGLLRGRKLHFFYGCRTAEDLFDECMLGADLRAACGLTSVLSEPGDGAACAGRTGFLHDVVRDTFGSALKDHEIYFAGPAVMSAAVQKMAFEAGVPMAQLHFDEFY